ncbi:hypothetical protein OUZ56_016947 [Daphnia magna]|uniref:Uncharacterized protein n=1 Tax=Daphnia magna TaxID=35525 RepID=A0ABR0ARS8_9CRUS|nr:hypothetical protein OUZ56_016947 [Daphnia magna]
MGLPQNSSQLSCQADLPRSRSTIDRDPDLDEKIDRRSDHSRLVRDRIGDQIKKFIRSDHS